MSSILTRTAKNYAALVTIQPRPTTLSHSLAIFTRLQQFGKITSFTNPTITSHDSQLSRGRDENHRVLVRYENADCLARAVDSSPLNVSVNHDLVDPQILDPFDVRGLQLRSRPTAGQFVCCITAKEEKGEEIDGRTALATEGQATGSRSTHPKLYQDLLAAGAHWSVAEGLASHALPSQSQPEALASRASQDPAEGRSDNVTQFLQSSQSLTSASLMTIYRESVMTGPKEIPSPPQRPSLKDRRRERSRRFQQSQVEDVQKQKSDRLSTAAWANMTL